MQNSGVARGRRGRYGAEVRGRIGGVVLVGLGLGCGGAGTGASAGEASTGGASAVGASTSGDGANTGPVSGTGGAAPTSGEGESDGTTTEAATTEAATSTSATSTGEAESTGAADCPARAQLGVWVWQPSQVTEPSQAAALLAFAAAQGVTHVYVESELLLAQEPERLAMFVEEADAMCVAVELLFGAAEWALAENHAVPLALVEDALDFVDRLAGARPVGLHFDVEPHGLADWDTNQATYAGEYLDLLEQMATNLQGSELALTVDVAFWYDGVLIERDGEQRPLSELVQDRVDRIVVMDYRDHAEPPDGILDNAAAEVAYAGTVGGRVRVAVESTCGLVPEKVTFCEEGAIAMSLALELTKMSYAGSPGWDGVAVHDFAAWSVLMD